MKQRARLAVVPTRANQYRPHLVRRWGLLLVIAFVFVFQGLYNFSTDGTILGDDSDLSATGLVEATNEKRMEHGLSELRVNAELNQAATLKAHDMIKQQYWSHTAPDGTTPWMFFNQVDYDYRVAGENLARNFKSSDSTVHAWMASTEHKRNILSEEYEEIGIAVLAGTLEGRLSTIIVALYGSPADPATVAGASVEAPIFLAASSGEGLSPVARFGVAIQGLTPAAIGSLAILMVVTVVALIAHSYRYHLPKSLKRTWYRHHGIIKSSGLIGIALFVLVIYGGGGQI